MNLGKLLGAGKSFFGGGETCRYRTDKRFYLPKFDLAEKSVCDPRQPARDGIAETAAPDPVGQKSPTPAGAKTQKMPVSSAQAGNPRGRPLGRPN